MVRQDFDGNVFPSVMEMCSFYGIPKTTFYHRLNRGWDEKKALTTPSPEAVDHNGKRYNTIKEMCEAYRVPQATFTSRISHGWSVKRALTTPTQSAADTEKSSVRSANNFETIMEFYAQNKDIVNDIIALYDAIKRLND